MGFQSTGEQRFDDKSLMAACANEINVDANGSKMDDDVNNECKNSSNRRINAVLENIRLFFESSKRNRSGSNTTVYSAQNSLPSSSGYQSLDTSLELEESYIKVAKFTETEEKTEFSHYGTLKEYQEMEQQQKLAAKIKELIESNPTSTIKISDYLTLRTAGDVMNLSKCEPYGLKGCKLILIIDNNGQTIDLGSVYPEKGIVCTFEITLVLHIKLNPCRRLPFFNCKQAVMNVLEQYELRKEKMYTGKKRRASPAFLS